VSQCVTVTVCVCVYVVRAQRQLAVREENADSEWCKDRMQHCLHHTSLPVQPIEVTTAAWRGGRDVSLCPWISLPYLVGATEAHTEPN
jgi:hypothetical protein